MTRLFHFALIVRSGLGERIPPDPLLMSVTKSNRTPFAPRFRGTNLGLIPSQ